jgi:hypothetical protein
MSVRRRAIQRIVNNKNQLHCEDGRPALVTNYRMEWWYEGKLHRIGGPAITGWNGYNYDELFYLHDKSYDKNRYNKILFIIKRFVNIIKNKHRAKLTREIYNLGICKDISKLISEYVI